MSNDPNGFPCPVCPSKDAYKLQENGWHHCFSCGHNTPPDKYVPTEPEPEPDPDYEPDDLGPLPPNDSYVPIPSRGFTNGTCQRYGISVDGDLIRYPIFSTDGKHIANKVRGPGKKFFIEGEFREPGLFGRHAFPAGSCKTITVTEGQDDAAAAYQLTGSKYAAVAVHSASSAKADVIRDFEYLNSFDEIVVAFDADEPGRRAAKEVASLGFPHGKVRILELRKAKDANDYLLAKETESFNREWWAAPVWRPDGLKLGSDKGVWDSIIARKDSFTIGYPFNGLNDLTFGLRLSELVTITADTGVGKTQVLKTIEHLLLSTPDIAEKEYGVGLMHLEEPNGDTALGLLSIHNRVPYHLPTSNRNETDIRRAYDELLNTQRFVLYDHFGSNSVDIIVDKVRHMAALGCKYIVIDHLSIIVSDQSGDERKQLDEIATKLKTITMELDLAVIAVIHTNRAGQIRGTAGVEQLSNIVIRLERNKLDADEWRRNITKLTVEKNRFSGYTGLACCLFYDKKTGTLSELNEDQQHTFLEGETLREDERW